MLFRHMEASPLAVSSRAGESVAEAVERCKRIRVLQREVRRQEAALRRESQFNRKVEINAALRQVEQALDQLKC